MVTLQDAKNACRDFLYEIFDSADISGLRVEEVERLEEGWELTLSFIRGSGYEDRSLLNRQMKMLQGITPVRFYRSVTVDGEGTAIRCEIREFAEQDPR